MDSKTQLENMIREDIIGELQAINHYTAHIEATDNAMAKKVWRDIRDEEKVHVGELITLLLLINPDEAEFLKQGENEVKNMYK